MRVDWKPVLIGGICAWSFFSFADSIKMETPADGAVVTPLHPVQEMLVRLGVEDWKKLIQYPAVSNYWKYDVKSFPGGVRIDWSVKRTTKDHLVYRLEYGRDPELKDVVKLFPPHSEQRLYNFYLGETCYYRVALVKDDGTVADQTPVLSFTVENLPPRVMMVPGVDNFRDIGGYKALEGRVIKQGMIYRSTGLNANSSDGGKTPGKPRFTDEGKRVMLEDLKLKTELDLRWAGEIAGMTTSPLGESVRYVNNPSPLYAGAFTADGKEIYAKSFRLFTDPENYPINFHCIAGSDRTGTLAYLLEAVLGMDEEMLAKEYVFTSFYSTRNFNNLAPIVTSLKACGKPGDSVMEQAERYWLSAGITPAEIQKFRDIMLGEGTKPDKILQEAQRRIDAEAALKAKYSQPVTTAQIVPYKVFKRTNTFAGKTFSCALPVPNKYRADWSTSADGGFLWRLGNTGSRPVLLQAEGKLPGKEDAKFYFGEVFADKWFKSPAGQAEWTLAELAELKFLLPSSSDRALVAVPVGSMEAPQVLEVYPEVTERHARIPEIMIFEFEETPEIGGEKADKAWEKVMTFPCHDVYGKRLKHAPVLKIAADKEHSVLYLRMMIPDTTPVAKLTGEQVKVWSEDSVEIFIAEASSDSYYQLVLGRSGGWYVEWRGAWKGRELKLPEGTKFAVREVSGGWTLEAAIPLAGLELKGYPRINVCGGDRPAELLFSLIPCNGSFHDLDAMAIPMFYKEKR